MIYQYYYNIVLYDTMTSSFHMCYITLVHKIKILDKNKLGITKS